MIAKVGEGQSSVLIKAEVTIISLYFHFRPLSLPFWFVCSSVICSLLYMADIIRGRKNRRALLAGNVKRLQEIRLNEDLLLKI